MDRIKQMVQWQLDDYFQDYPDNAAMQDLKEELATDLVETANDYTNQGEKPTAAVQHAFNGLGDLDELVDEINQNKHTTDTNHGFSHHIDITDGRVLIDDGKTLKIDEHGISAKSGKAMRIDKDGVDINDGTVTLNQHGVKLGDWVFDRDGMHTQGDDQNEQQSSNPFTKFDQEFNQSPASDTEIYVESLDLVNEFTADPADVQRINFTYQDSVRVLANPDSDQIIVREYMSRQNSTYLATHSVFEGTFNVHSGKRPHFLPLRSRVQLLIPANFHGDLLLDNRSGSTRMNHFGELGKVRIIARSGSLQIVGGTVQALDIDAHSGTAKLEQTAIKKLLQINAHSGSVRLTTVKASQMQIDAQSGAIRGTNVVGSGKITAHSGAINIQFQGLTGDLHADSRSGSVKLAIAPGNAYTFELASASGSVTAPNHASFEHDTTAFKAGHVGENPQYHIDATTQSGIVKLQTN